MILLLKQKNNMDPLSYSHLPIELWGMIVSNIHDAPTAASLQGVSRTLHHATRHFMSEEVAAARVFYRPSLYAMYNERLKNSRPVVLNALSQDPTLFDHPSFPPSLRNDSEIKKTVLVAARLLISNGKTRRPDAREETHMHAQEICQRLKSQERDVSFQKIEEELDALTPLSPPVNTSELWALLPFALHGPFYLATHYQNASPAIRSHYYLSLALLKKGYNIYEHLDLSLQQDRTIVHTALLANGRLLEKVPPVFQGDLELVRIASRKDPRVLRFATVDIQTRLRGEGVNPETALRYSMATLKLLNPK